MNKAIRYAAVAVLLGTCATSARAATVICGGTVQKLAYHQPGQLMLQLSSMNYPVFICSTDGDWVVPGSLAGNTSPSTCKALYATFLTAKASGSTLSSVYFDGDGLPSSCNSFAPWTRVNLRYFDLL